MNNEEHEVIVLQGKVKVIWLAGGKRNEKVFDSYEKAKPLMEELNEKGELWVMSDKV